MATYVTLVRCVCCPGQKYTISVLLTMAIYLCPGFLCQIFLSNSYQLCVPYEKCGMERGWKGRWLVSGGGFDINSVENFEFFSATAELFCVN